MVANDQSSAASTSGLIRCMIANAHHIDSLSSIFKNDGFEGAKNEKLSGSVRICRFPWKTVFCQAVVPSTMMCQKQGGGVETTRQGQLSPTTTNVPNVTVFRLFFWVAKKRSQCYQNLYHFGVHIFASGFRHRLCVTENRRHFLHENDTSFW